MHHALDPDHIVGVVIDALTLYGTVAAVPHIRGGLTVRVTGRTNRARASVALAGAGYPVTRDETHGTLHIPAPRKAPLWMI